MEPKTMAEKGLSQEQVQTITGFRLAVLFPHWQEDAAGIIDFHEEQDRLEQRFGATNVIGSLFDSEGVLALGVFVRQSALPED